MTQELRTEILRAAGRVVAREGVKRLTLEAVAAEAKASKGGLLYHFRTKEALIRALVADLVARFDSSLTAYAAAAGPGAHVRAYIQATFDDANRDLDAASAGVVAAVANDPALLEPLREAYRRWQKQFLHDGIDPTSATIVRLAVDGLWFAHLLGIEPLPNRLLAQVLSRLEALARGEGA